MPTLISGCGSCLPEGGTQVLHVGHGAEGDHELGGVGVSFILHQGEPASPIVRHRETLVGEARSEHALTVRAGAVHDVCRQGGTDRASGGQRPAHGPLHGTDRDRDMVHRLEAVTNCRSLTVTGAH